MTDDQQFLSHFEACTLPYEEWTHRAHVRVAFLYASTYKFDDAVNAIRSAIKAYNAAVQTPEAINRGYHETITVAFMRLVHAAVTSGGPYESSSHFCNVHPNLLSKSVLNEYYSRDHLMTWTAKKTFVDPDKQPLPNID